MKSKNSQARGQKQEVRGQRSAVRGSLFTALLLSLSAAALAQTYVPLPFEDNFDNGVQANSDSETGFWSAFSQNTVGKLEETGGNWVFTCGPHGSATGDPAGGYRKVLISGNANGARFNIFEPEFGLSARGLAFEFLAGDGPQTGAVRTVQAASLDISVHSEGANGQVADHSLSLVVYGNGRILFGNKINQPSFNPHYTASSRAFDFTLPGNAMPTGFDLWLDEPEDGVYKRVNMVAYYGDAQSYSTNALLKTPFTTSDWANGTARLTLYAERYYMTDPQDSARVTIGSLGIMPFYTPGLLLFGYLPPQRPDFKAALRPKTELN